MAKISKNQKQDLLQGFELAKSIELSAAELYTKIANDPAIEQQNIITTFKNLARDEHRHAQIVQEIIDLINKAL